MDPLGQSVQFSCSVISDSLQPHEPQHARPPCPSPTPRVHPNPCPLSWWCHPAISSSVVPFSSCPQSFPASGSFPMSQLFASGGQSIGVSASTSVLPMNTQDWSPLGWTGWISSQSKGLSRVFPNTTVQKHLSFAECYSITSSSVLFSSHIFWYISFLQIHSTMQTRWAVSDRFRRNSQSCKREVRCNIFCPSTCYCFCLEYPSPWCLQ